MVAVCQLQSSGMVKALSEQTKGAPPIRTLCVFCASSSNLDQKYYDLGKSVGHIIASAGVRLVYGGASGGVMGVVADAVLAEGGEAVGVIPEVLSGQERAHQGLTELHVTEDMQQRQRKMADLSDAFLVLPGGLGTLAELFEILTWKQIRLHQKPVIILNSYGFWGALFKQFEHCHQEQFMYSDPSELFELIDKPEEINDFLLPD